MQPTTQTQEERVMTEFVFKATASFAQVRSMQKWATGIA
jgi:hypothetical protein